MSTETDATGSADLATGMKVAVIGAGAFGSWTALSLVRMGASVVLVDCWGPGNSRSSSGGETRVLRFIYGEGEIYTRYTARSVKLWNENQERWGARLFQPTGQLWLFTADDQYARISMPVARDCGVNVSQWELAEARSRYPQVDFDGIHSVYFEHDSGFLHARQACQTVCEHFQLEGGEYRSGIVTPGLEPSREIQHVELADGSRVEADQFVFACGPWLGQIFPETVGDSIRPTRQEVLYFGVPAGDPSFDVGNFPTWSEFGERVVYGLPNHAGRGFKFADDTRGPVIDPTVEERTPTAEAIATAREYIGIRFPALRSAPLVESRICQYENSPDGDVIFGQHPAAPNLWIVGGGSGHGFKFSPALGEHVARCVCRDTQPEAAFALERLATIESRSTQFGVG